MCKGSGRGSVFRPPPALLHKPPQPQTPATAGTNGGPGSDSLGGFFTELGPFIANAFDDGQTLRRNPFTWNLVSNVLYLTHPTGVGYSYRGDDENVHTDESDAIDNAKFLRKFFAAYPEFAENDFWLTGESYAGICKRNRHCPAQSSPFPHGWPSLTVADRPLLVQDIPMTAVEIAKGNDAGLEPSINLVGLFVGNGCTGNKTPSCGEAEGTTPLLHTSSVSPSNGWPQPSRRAVV